MTIFPSTAALASQTCRPGISQGTVATVNKMAPRDVLDDRSPAELFQALLASQNHSMLRR